MHSCGKAPSLDTVWTVGYERGKNKGEGHEGVEDDSHHMQYIPTIPINSQGDLGDRKDE